eukprot:6688623-Heterocapsa_arctica.AAC.1
MKTGVSSDSSSTSSSLSLVLCLPYLAYHAILRPRSADVRVRSRAVRAAARRPPACRMASQRTRGKA